MHPSVNFTPDIAISTMLWFGFPQNKALFCRTKAASERYTARNAIEVRFTKAQEANPKSVVSRARRNFPSYFAY